MSECCIGIIVVIGIVIVWLLFVIDYILALKRRIKCLENQYLNKQ